LHYKPYKKLFFNVEDFGAVGDEVTINTTAIQNAINVCRDAGGGSIFIPKGIFLTDTLTLYSNVSIKGENKWLSILKLINDPTGPLLNCSGTSYSDIKSNIVISNVHLKHIINYTPVHPKGTLVYADYTSLCEISDCILSEYSSRGIVVSHTNSASDQTKSWLITRNAFLGNDVASIKGVYLINAGEYVHIADNVFHNLNVGVQSVDCANIRITDNKIVNCAYGMNLDHQVVGNNAGKYIIEGNTINHCGSAGIYVNLMGVSTNGILITGNILYLNYANGIYVKGVYGSVISNNKILVGAGGTVGILLAQFSGTYKGDYNLVQGNSISGGTISNTMGTLNNVSVNNIENIT